MQDQKTMVSKTYQEEYKRKYNLRLAPGSLKNLTIETSILWLFSISVFFGNFVQDKKKRPKIPTQFGGEMTIT
jgi:hypothetical protein